VEKPDRSSDDPAVRREEAAAEAEAGAIGGPAPDVEGDEASRPVEEGGGGVAEGFEESERELAERASHGDEAGDPEDDAFSPEAERSTTRYGEPDEVDPTEVVEDPDEERPDDPGEGPGIAADR
jgi:hypothetical protein